MRHCMGAATACTIQHLSPACTCNWALLMLEAHLSDQAPRLHASHLHGCAAAPQQPLLLPAAAGAHKGARPGLLVGQRLRHVHRVDASRHT